jgi:hypothetical protein
MKSSAWRGCFFIATDDCACLLYGVSSQGALFPLLWGSLDLDS